MPAKSFATRSTGGRTAVRLGGKVNDTRTIIGGEVQSKSPGKELFVIALDFSAQYPAQTEANNISMNTRVDERIIRNPSMYGLECIKHKNIYDCYDTREVYWFKHSEEKIKENPSVKDKVYRVEQFNCAYKLDVDQLKKDLAVLIDPTVDVDSNRFNSAVRSIKELYPECDWDEEKHCFRLPNGKMLTISNLPDTITKKVYFVQSHKAENGWTDEHLSLNEIMLTDLRFTRNAVKKQAAKAEEEGREFDAIRFNSKQLAVKIVCNSTYGASGSRFYAYYDPEIGASITWAAREMIHDLTRVLESDKVYVDKEFLEKNKKQYDALLKYGIVEEVPCDPKKDNPEKIIPLSLRRLFDEYWDVKDYSSLIRLNLKPAKIIYQDTDSNYYIIRHVQELFKGKYDPDSINECMQLMKMHNEFFQDFMAFSVFRPPIGLGFEAAKIVARYFNVKKRYYGIEWGPWMKSRLCDDAYENGVLKQHYNQWWRPGQTTLPREDGAYLNVDPVALLDEGLDFVAYMHHQNLSVTGMPLTRRDSYRFANYLNLEVYRNDLMVSRYVGNNNWETCLKDSLEEVIHDVINTFKEQINYVETLVNDALNDVDREYKLPVPFFHLKDYSRQAQYKPDKKNDVMDAIRKRYDENGRKPIEIFERVNYVAMNTPEAKAASAAGKADIGKESELAFTIDELIDEYHEKMPRETYDTLKCCNDIDYDTFIEMYIISDLCFRHYMKALCLTLAPFAAEYLKKDELINARENIMDKDERKKQIAKATDDAGKELLKRYFTFGKDTFQTFKEISKQWEKHYKVSKKPSARIHQRVLEEIHSIFPTHAHITDATRFKMSLNRIIPQCEARLQAINEARNAFLTNRFNRPAFDNECTEEWYNIMEKGGMERVLREYSLIEKRRNQVNWILSQLP